MKKSEEKKKLVKELAGFHESLGINRLYAFPNQKDTQKWIADVGSILKNLDESDYQEFVRLSKTVGLSEIREERKKAAKEINQFLGRKVAEYKRYDFSYLDRREISPKEKDKVVKVLQERGVKNVCPMCGNKHFVLANAYFSNTLQSGVGNISLGGPNIPTVPIICSNCGFVSQHALGILGMLPEESGEREGKEDA